MAAGATSGRLAAPMRHLCFLLGVLWWNTSAAAPSPEQAYTLQVLAGLLPLDVWDARGVDEDTSELCRFRWQSVRALEANAPTKVGIYQGKVDPRHAWMNVSPYTRNSNLRSSPTWRWSITRRRRC